MVSACSGTAVSSESSLPDFETAIETEVAAQLVMRTEVVAVEQQVTATALPEPTATSTLAAATATAINLTPGWYQLNDWNQPSNVAGFAKVKTIPAILYASPEDAILQTNKKRTLPGDEVYVSYVSTIRVNDRLAYEVEPGGWMSAEQLEEITPSAFVGIQLLENSTHKFGWVVESAFSFTFSPDTFRQKKSGHYYQRYQFFEVFSDYIDAEGNYWYEIGEGEWISDEVFAIVRLQAASPEQVHRQRWIAVDLTQQNLVVYEDGQPVFATLISTGAQQGWTFAGTHTIYNTAEEYDLFSPDPKVIGNYFLEDVPWILFYESSWAIHGAYWHDSFGLPNSHGCVNFSMRDAGWLYDWAQTSDYVFLFW